MVINGVWFLSGCLFASIVGFVLVVRSLIILAEEMAKLQAENRTLKQHQERIYYDKKTDEGFIRTNH